VCETKLTRGHSLLFAAVAALVVICRLLYLTGQSLWYDEGVSVMYSDTATLWDNLLQLASAQSSERYQPLYFTLLWGWRGMFGDAVLVLRLFSVLAGIGAVLLVFSIAKRVFGRSHAIWSALIMAVSSYCVFYSQEVRPYAFLTLLTLIQLWLWIQADAAEHQGGPTVWRRLFWVSVGVGAFGSLFVGLFTVGLCAVHLATANDRRRWLNLWLPAVLAMLPAAIFFAGFGDYAETTSTISRMRQPLLLNTIFIPYGILVGTTYGPPLDELRGGSKFQALCDYAPQLIILTLAVAAIAVAWVHNLTRQAKEAPRRDSDIFFALLTVLSFLLLVSFAAITKLNLLPRHAFSLMPILALTLPSVLIRDGSPTRVSRIGFLGLAVLLLLNLFSLWKYYFDPRHARDDYRGATEYVRTNITENTKAILVWGLPRLFTYYGASEVIDGRGISKVMLAGEVRRLSGGADSVILLLNRWFYWDSDPDALEKHMYPGYELKSKVELAQFKIYTFARADASVGASR